MRVKWNKQGLAYIAKGQASQALVFKQAQKIAAIATALSGRAFIAVQSPATKRGRAAVVCNSIAAATHNRENNTMLRATFMAKGGA